MNQEVARELLVSVGISVDVVDDGGAAVTRLQEASYDLVLMDLRMPGVDGLEAAKTIRRNPAFADLPIIAMTANAMESDRQACLDAGMNDHIGKPVEPEELYSVLASWADRIGERRAQDASVAFVVGRDAPAASPEDVALIERLAPFLDVRGGLDRVLNRHDLYLSLLRSYSAGQRDVALQVREALATGNRDEATRHAHTANGLAGQIGAEGVRVAAERLESELRTGGSDDEVDAAIGRLESALVTIVGAIDMLVPERRQTPRPPKNEPLTVEQLAALNQIVRLLEADDPRARTLWHANSVAFADVLSEATHVLVTTAVDTFDFEVAREALNRTIEFAKPD